MKITTEQLIGREACKDQVAIFNREWPSGTEITLKSLERATELELNLDWFAGRFLPPLAYKAYLDAIREAYGAYINARGEAWKYSNNPAREIYRKAKVTIIYKLIQEEEAQQCI